MARCVVTGGSGFLGRHLIDALLANDRPATKVVVFDLRPYEHHNPETADSIEVHVGTVSQLGDLVKAFREASVVYHCISANPIDNRNERLMTSVNVDGTKNVIEACKQTKVGKLIFISSASVVFDGSHMIDVDESTPYPRRFVDFYSKSKAEAERLVLESNRDTLLTCAIRPSSIFGERDVHYIPRVIENARNGKTRYIVGNGKTHWELTYVGNVAHACILAADKLSPSSPAAGQAYFITNDETTTLWSHIGSVCSALGYEEPSIKIPYFLCIFLATIVDLILLIISPFYTPPQPPTFTTERIRLVGTHRKINISKAKKDLGYKPLVSMEEGTRRTIDFFKSEAAWADAKKD